MVKFYNSHKNGIEIIRFNNDPKYSIDNIYNVQ